MQAPTTQAATPSMPRQIAGPHSGSRPPAATSLSSIRRRRLYLPRPPRYPARQPRLSPDETFRATRRRTTSAATVGRLSSPSLALSAPFLPFGSPTNASRRSHLLLLDDPSPPLLMDRRQRRAAARVPAATPAGVGIPGLQPPIHACGRNAPLGVAAPPSITANTCGRVVPRELALLHY